MVRHNIMQSACISASLILFLAFFYSMMNISLSGFSSFLPLIVRSFGYSTVATQILTIPVYIAAAISTVGLAVVSDRVRNRGHFLTVSFATASLGWLFLIVSKSNGLSLAGCFLVGMGTYPTVVLIQAWLSSNVIGFTKRYVQHKLLVESEANNNSPGPARLRF
jgi:hypothetical protein